MAQSETASTNDFGVMTPKPMMTIENRTTAIATLMLRACHARIDAMDVTEFHALKTGRIVDGGTPRTLTVHDLGLLQLPSGRVEACDPFVTLGGHGVVVKGLPPGAYPVKVTVADVSSEQDGSHLREAYLSLVLAEGGAASVEDIPDVGVSVDAGTVGFVDADAVARCMPDGNWYEELFEPNEDPEGTSWFALMDSPAHLLAGCANIVMPLATAGENVVLAHSGWGDGVYPLVLTRDAEGRTLALHIDLLVVGAVEMKSRATRERTTASTLTSRGLIPDRRPGFLKRLFGRRG